MINSGSGCRPLESERDAVANNAARREFTVKSGRACKMHAAAPANNGVLKLVPLTPLMPDVLVLFTVAVLTPMAKSSGFTRPSTVGPSVEKLAMAPVLSTAPHEITCNASAGAINVLVAGLLSWPSLPAAVKQISPLAVAIFTAIVVTAVTPFMSFCVYQSIYPSELVAMSAPCASTNSRPAT